MSGRLLAFLAQLPKCVTHQASISISWAPSSPRTCQLRGASASSLAHAARGAVLRMRQALSGRMATRQVRSVFDVTMELSTAASGVASCFAESTQNPCSTCTGRRFVVHHAHECNPRPCGILDSQRLHDDEPDAEPPADEWIQVGRDRLPQPWEVAVPSSDSERTRQGLPMDRNWDVIHVD